MTTTGSDIEHKCNKCGDVWHVVVAMVGDQVVQVQCKECGGYRKIRPKAKKATTTRTRSRAASTKATSAVVEADLSRDIRPYSMREKYEPGDRVEHPKFGLGVVETQPAPNKMEVRFPEGRRVLVMARGA